MSVATAERLTLADAARIIREATKDKSYQATPIGGEIRRFLHWFASEVGATPRSVLDYESVLKELALLYADLKPADFEIPAGTGLLRDLFARVWPHAAPNTRKKIRAYHVSFFDYLIEEGRMISNPARAMRTPRIRGIDRDLIATRDKRKLLAGQARARDTLAVRLLFALALRKSELGAIQFKHFDFARRRLRVFGKGGTVYDMPVPRDIMDAIERHTLGRDLDEYLLYPEKRGPRFTGGPLELLWEDRRSPLSSVALHRWWKARLAESRVRDYKLHATRYSAITDFLRSSGNLKLTQQFARHASVQTTADIYAQTDDVDLEREMERVAAKAFRSVEDTE